MPRPDIAKDGKPFVKGDPRINRKGQPPSLKRAMLELIQKDGSLRFKKEQIKTMHDDGSISVIIPTAQALMIKLVSLAGGGNIKALQILLEYIDGKAKENVKIEGEITTLPQIIIKKND